MMRIFKNWLAERAWRRKVDDATVRLMLVRSTEARLVAEHTLLCLYAECPPHVKQRLLRERGLA